VPNAVSLQVDGSLVLPIEIVLGLGMRGELRMARKLEALVRDGLEGVGMKREQVCSFYCRFA